MNLRARERAFDLESYLKSKDDRGKEYPPNMAIYCPHCETAEKLWVLLVDKAADYKRGSWICYKCGEGGATIRSLIQWVEDCSKIEATRILVEGTADRKDRTRIRELVMETLYGLNEQTEFDDSDKIVTQDLPSEFELYDPETAPKTVTRYFKSRGITDARAEKYALGYCEDGYFQHRMVVPVVFDGDVKFFVARWLKKKPPKGTKKTIYPKGSCVSRVLFNYDKAKHKRQIVIVEDVFSAMHIGSSAVATFGTSLSAYHLELLLETSAREIVVLWDRDAIDKARALAGRLAEFWTVRVVELPAVCKCGHDRDHHRSDDDCRTCENCREYECRDPDEWSRTSIELFIKRAQVYSPRTAFRSEVLDRL